MTNLYRFFIFTVLITSLTISCSQNKPQQKSDLPKTEVKTSQNKPQKQKPVQNTKSRDSTVKQNGDGSITVTYH
jgi:hypothetical protein